MKANELHSHLVKIQADEGTKSALLAIIDQKIDSDMEKNFAKIGAEFQPIRSEIQIVRSEMKTEIQSIRSEMKAETSNIKWTISIVIAVASILIALIVKYL